MLALIDTEYESDAAFERSLGLAEKTVNNWRRGRSSSFMRMLPLLSEKFGVSVGALLDMPIRRDTSELSEEELHLLRLYRRARALPQPMRVALRETLERTVGLYLESYLQIKAKHKENK